MEHGIKGRVLVAFLAIALVAGLGPAAALAVETDSGGGQLLG